MTKGLKPVCPRDRRNVAVSGPVYKQFSSICGALGLVREQVATRELHRWCRRNARRAADAHAAHAAALGGAAVS